MSTEARATNQGLGAVGAGAAIGTAIMPGVGTSIGAAVGGIVSAFGLGNKAKKYAKKARKVQQEREDNAEEENYLQMIRQARSARASSLAGAYSVGIETSSLATSALSSIGAQSQHNVQYTANDARLVELYNKYMKKAGAYSNAAKTAMATGQLVSTLAGIGGAISGAVTAGAGSLGANVTGLSGSNLISTSLATEVGSKALQTNLLYAGLFNQTVSAIGAGVPTI